jgi:hypothetical protein
MGHFLKVSTGVRDKLNWASEADLHKDTVISTVTSTLASSGDDRPR